MANDATAAELDSWLYAQRREWRRRYWLIEQIALLLAGFYVVISWLLDNYFDNHRPTGGSFSTLSLLFMLGLGALYLVCSQQRSLQFSHELLASADGSVMRVAVHRHARRIGYMWLSLLLLIPLLFGLVDFAFHHGSTPSGQSYVMLAMYCGLIAALAEFTALQAVSRPDSSVLARALAAAAMLVGLAMLIMAIGGAILNPLRAQLTREEWNLYSTLITGGLVAVVALGAPVTFYLLAKARPQPKEPVVPAAA